MTPETIAAAIAVGVAVVALIVVIVLVSSSRKRASEAAEAAAAAEQRAEALRQYQVIPDAMAEASRIVTAANAHAQQAFSAAQAQAAQLRQEAEAAAYHARASAEARAAEIQHSAQQSLAQAQARAESILGEATAGQSRAAAQAAEIVRAAQQEAERIAGDALRVRDQAETYARTAAAMKNTIEGYGDACWVPAQSLLDELADEFDHKEAGQRLKEARDTTRALQKQDRAAECDYVERNRRETAIRFVVDAFNGKVDSILSKLKHDNYGVLEQKIKDAFALVNHNGAAFRNARINATYLDARLQELKWAVTAMELRRQEQDEQRRIRDQLREEERARKEYEQAIKNAEKEEKTLQRALLKAEERLAEASAAQRAEYEQQLEQLRKQLAEAEARNQRALSMAQQTRLGHVYVISNVGSFGDHVYKVGLTRRLEPKDRVRELGDASVPFEFDIHAMIWAEDAPALEAELHRRFASAQVNKVNPRKEFFRVQLADVRAVVDEMGLDVHWTMVAEAREYRESQALARRGAVGEGERTLDIAARPAPEHAAYAT
jgi:DNA repair exonuclease SbcCD ATPase subunit